MAETVKPSTKPETETEQNPQLSRRGLFHIMGAVPAAAALAGGSVAFAQSHEHMHIAAEAQSATSGTDYKRQTFDDHQWETVKVLCDLIIPADERSGSATQAGVPEFLDDWIAYRTVQDNNEDLKAQIFGGLMWLDRESNRQFEKAFAEASAEQQKQLLDRIAYPKKAAKEDRAWVHFFNEFRSLTVGGFFSSKTGVADLPYLGNVAVMHWQGCDPKVWAVIEDRLKNGYKGILEAKPWGSTA
ncbi:MAG TPA: gluconate 2-dehydrogenase subunit 3 family protein [Bryobacteraceae bacterium]|nr:gluconate 2-dehydrogenase subunit 3 family protein [Bryobacteraceae bacterium]